MHLGADVLLRVAHTWQLSFFKCRKHLPQWLNPDLFKPQTARLGQFAEKVISFV
jgi:hypothetical protein